MYSLPRPLPQLWGNASYYLKQTTKNSRYYICVCLWEQGINLTGNMKVRFILYTLKSLYKIAKVATIGIMTCIVLAS